jgi:cytochrome c-type biogenesis protein CcmE
VLASVGSPWTTPQNGTEYFKHVDEAVADRQAGRQAPSTPRGSDPGSIMVKPNTMDIRFRCRTTRFARANGHVMNVTYSGIVPDTFKGEAEVVLHGKLTADGFKTDPNGVIAKCPSKYEAAAGS